MISSLHVATGGVAGALAGSRAGALALGPLLHLAGDLTPHWDIRSRRYEIVSAGAAALAIAVRHGPFSPATLGALAAAAPDLEHVLRLPRPGGRKLFPSHRRAGWHVSGGLSTSAQLFAAGVLIGGLLSSPRRPPASST